MNVPLILLEALLLTLIIELIVALILSVRDKKDILNIILVNVITNPALVTMQLLLYVNFGYKVELIGIIIMEILVVFIEGLIYKKELKYNAINPFLLSLLLNASSLFIGKVISML